MLGFCIVPMAKHTINFHTKRMENLKPALATLYAMLHGWAILLGILRLQW